MERTVSDEPFIMNRIIETYSWKPCYSKANERKFMAALEERKERRKAEKLLKMQEKRRMDRENKEKNKDTKSYPKEFTNKRRIMLDYAREHDGCTACGTHELLQVHHVDKNKFNNSDENLLVLCFYCHAKEHKHMQGKQPPIWLK